MSFFNDQLRADAAQPVPLLQFATRGHPPGRDDVRAVSALAAQCIAIDETPASARTRGAGGSQMRRLAITGPPFPA